MSKKRKTQKRNHKNNAPLTTSNFIDRHMKIIRFKNKDGKTLFGIGIYNPEKNAYELKTIYKTEKKAQKEFSKLSLEAITQFQMGGNETN